MEIQINGEVKTVEAPLSVAGLLLQLGLAGKRVAVEVNSRIVPRSRHEAQYLRDGDRVEIIQAIGGG